MRLARFTLLLAALAAAATLPAAGCRSRPAAKKPAPPAAAGGGMTVLEARSALARAREALYGSRESDTDLAIRLAESVITHSDPERYPWLVGEAFFVEASACQAAGNHTNAARSARHGVDTILLASSGPPGRLALTSLKMLLPLYIESAAASREQEDPVQQVRLWKGEVLYRYKAARDAAPAEVAAVAEAFGLLEEMAEQHVLSREPETQIERAVCRWVAAFNARDAAGLLAVLAPNSRLARAVAAGGAGALATPSVHRIHLGSGVHVQVQSAGAAAVATCDLVGTSATGWATVVERVTFRCAKSPAGEWRIEDITGLP